MAKKILGLKDFIAIDYTMSGDEQLAKQSQKRKTEEVEDTNEVLNIAQRRAVGRRMKRMKAKIAMGKKRAARKVASMDKLKIRARKQARNMLIKKIVKDTPKADLSMARKKEIEKRLEKPAFQNRIARIAKKSLPKIRRAEIQKKRGTKNNQVGGSK
tara:strand:+ start:16324 stop:16794 length:471 start_codon:yes stop_codon:yes gene_type:complete